jgi:ABC-type dipeptide/oligopeptide/nickel transport system permease subunit
MNNFEDTQYPDPLPQMPWWAFLAPIIMIVLLVASVIILGFFI